MYRVFCIGYNLTAADDIDDDKRIKTWHKYIEALKFAFARRPLLGDPSFEKNVTKVKKTQKISSCIHGDIYQNIMIQHV